MSATAQIDPQEDTRAELFVSEGRQAIRLPLDMRLDGDSVNVRRVEGGLLLETPILPRIRTAEELKTMWAYIDSLGADPLLPEWFDGKPVEPEDLFD